MRMRSFTRLVMRWDCLSGRTSCLLVETTPSGLSYLNQFSRRPPTMFVACDTTRLLSYMWETTKTIKSKNREILPITTMIRTRYPGSKLIFLHAIFTRSCCQTLWQSSPQIHVTIQGAPGVMGKLLQTRQLVIFISGMVCLALKTMLSY